jgi:hypothetical protein
MVILWERIRLIIYFFDPNILLFQIRRLIWKPKRSKKSLKEQISKDYDMAGMEWYRLELFKSIAKIPDEILPYLADRVYCK